MWGVGVAFMVTLVPLPPHAADLQLHGRCPTSGDDGGPLLCHRGLRQLRGCDPGIRNPGHELLPSAPCPAAPGDAPRDPLRAFVPLRAAGGGPDPGRLGADDGGPLLCPDGLLQLRGCDPGIRNPGQGLLHPARDVGDRTLKTHVLLHYDVFQASESATQAKWRVPGLRNAHYKKVFGTLLRARSASLRGRDQVGGGGGEDGDETEEIDDGNLRLISQDVCCIYDGQKTGRDLMLSAETQNAVPKMPFRGTSDQRRRARSPSRSR